MLFVTMLEVSYLNYRNQLPELPLYLLYLNFLNADSYFQILLYFKLSELFSQFPGLFLTNLKLNSNQFQANACFLKALKISEKLIFFIPYKRNIYLKWVDKLSKSVKFTSNFFDVPIFKFAIDMVDSILHRTLGTCIPKVVLQLMGLLWLLLPLLLMN